MVNESINDKLNKVSLLSQNIKDYSQLCQTLITMGSEDDNAKDIDDLIGSILKDITILKDEQTRIALINFENIIIYNGQTYKVIELIKIKEKLKMQVDFLDTQIKLMDNLKEIFVPNESKILSDKAKLLLNYQILINNLRKEYNAISKTLINYNMKVKNE